MAYPQGINFRLTSGYVSDGANEDYEIDVGGAQNYPRTTPQGNNVGWETTSSSYEGRDRDSGLDRRLAGIGLNSSTIPADYRFDLSASGSYNIKLAVGDASNAQGAAVEVFDTSSSLGTLSTGSTSAAGQFKDATGTEYSAANWPGSNTAASKTFSTTICRLRFGTGATFATVAHVYIESAASAPVFTVHPSNQQANAGSTATFSATATGATSYQWQVNKNGAGWVSVTGGSGATTDTYTTGTLDGSEINWIYRLAATNAVGTTYSNTATLSVWFVTQAFQSDAFQPDAWQVGAISSSSGATLTLAVTLDPIVVALAGTSGHTLTTATTLGDVVVAVAGTVGHSASVAISLADVVPAIAGTVGHSSTIAVTLDDVVPTIAATVSSGASLTATLQVTLDDVVPSIAGTVGHSLTTATTLDPVVVAVAGTNGHPSTVAIQLDDVVPAVVCTVGHSATVAISLADVVPAISGTNGHPASLAVTLEDVAVTIEATVASAGNYTAVFAVQLDDITTTTTTVVGHPLNVAIQLADVSPSITAVLGHPFSVSITLEDVVVSISTTNSHAGSSYISGLSLYDVSSLNSGHTVGVHLLDGMFVGKGTRDGT